MAPRRLLAVAGFVLASACYPSAEGMRTNAANDVKSRLDRSSILLVDEAADSYGLTSRGWFQARGNGCLGASSIAVLFVPWAGDDELWIPMDRVLAVDATDSHLGKAKGAMLLRVRFVNEQGEQDSVAWAVKDVPRWVSTLQATRRAYATPAPPQPTEAAPSESP
jgi:hypothetical protein